MMSAPEKTDVPREPSTGGFFRRGRFHAASQPLCDDGIEQQVEFLILQVLNRCWQVVRQHMPRSRGCRITWDMSG
jgi:hypothetical protein